ncbi:MULTISPECIES: hypothetical protein [Chryseobacterium]|uniref:hypothetical protein n=1 Tax=Chryseobacterium TaxID=59732 RepID=UPI001BEABBCF|nr:MULTISPECIES: hypothetical protein [Chryseobacterium]MBT2623013.1 hypothetical protein [Chryseobacterium sp. ISL-6]
MAGEIYFIKTNPTIAKINLYKKLCGEENIVLGYLDEDRKTSLEIIKTKVKENIEDLTPTEFCSIFRWFQSEYKDENPGDSNGEEEVINQLFIHGIDQFYEIPTEDVRSFNQIISDYQRHSKNTLHYKFNADNFSQFLIYGIFFTGLMNQLHNKESENIQLMDYLKPDYKTLYSFAEDEFKATLQDAEKKSIPYRDILYNYFNELYDLTRFYKGCIIKLQNS